MHNLGRVPHGLRAIHHWMVGRDNEYEWLPYLWLSYFLLYFIPLIGAELPSALVLAAWIFGALAVCLYFLALRRARAWVILCMLLVGFSVTLFYQGGVILLAYSATMMGFVARRRFALLLMAVYAGAALSITIWVPLAELYLFLMWVALLWGFGNTIHRRNEERSRILRLTQREAQAIARLQERERIRADLHDLLGQSLTTISLNMQVLARASLSEPDRQRIITQTQDLARQALAHARETLHNNYQATLEEVIASCRVACLAKGVQLKLSTLPRHLNVQKNHAIAQVIRESVTNTLRHSEASNIHIELSEQKQQLAVTITDNGGGQPNTLGTGLNSLKARIEELGGQVVFSPGWQTAIRLPE